MDKQEAFKIVYDDLMNSGCGFFKGQYDAKYGSDVFMFGISTVIEYIASNISEECYEEFNDMFIGNMMKCEQEIVDDNTGS